MFIAFHETFRNCSLHDAILHLLFEIFIRMILGFPRAKQGLCHYDKWGGDPSLIRYSSKTAEQNFMKLSGIVHYIMPYCTSYFKFWFEWFWGLCHTKHGEEGGYHFVSTAHSISSFNLLSYHDFFCVNCNWFNHGTVHVHSLNFIS